MLKKELRNRGLTQCFYNKATTDGVVPPALSHNHHCAHVVRAMEPVYVRMSDLNLLKRIVKGKTQITNESYHGVVWSHC